MATNDARWWFQTVPVIYPLTCLELAKERGANVDNIIRQADLPFDILKHPTSEISLSQMKLLVEVVIDNIGDDGIGIELGLRLPPTAFGNLGYALLCSKSIEDVVELCVRFWHLLARTIMDLSLHASETICVLDFTIMAPLPESIQRFICEVALTSIYQGFRLLADAEDEDMELWFCMPPPSYAEKSSSLLGRVHYNMPSNQFRFSSHLMQKRLSMYNATGLKFAVEQCIKEEELLNNDQRELRQKVCQKLSFGKNGYLTLEEISQHMNMTARTLRRRLDNEGTSFKSLLESAKRRDAIRLLDDRNMEIQRIAAFLGYQEPANFTRAFRQWTGQTPSQYRMMHAK